MRKNAPDCGTTHTYTREAERTQGQTHTWTDTHESTVMRMNASECARRASTRSRATRTATAPRTSGRRRRTSNDTSFSVDDLDGAQELEDEGEEEDQEEDQDDELLDELDTVIVAAGKTVDQIKMMHILEKQKHAEACNKNRSITAQSVNELATKWGCPSEHKTKFSKLGWIINKLYCTCRHEQAISMHSYAYSLLMIHPTSSTWFRVLLMPTAC